MDSAHPSVDPNADPTHSLCDKLFVSDRLQCVEFGISLVSLPKQFSDLNKLLWYICSLAYEGEVRMAAVTFFLMQFNRVGELSDNIIRKKAEPMGSKNHIVSKTTDKTLGDIRSLLPPRILFGISVSLVVSRRSGTIPVYVTWDLGLSVVNEWPGTWVNSFRATHQTSSGKVLIGKMKCLKHFGKWCCVVGRAWATIISTEWIVLQHFCNKMRISNLLGHRVI